MDPEPTILALPVPLELLSIGKLRVGCLEPGHILLLCLRAVEDVVLSGLVGALRGRVHHFRVHR